MSRFLSSAEKYQAVFTELGELVNTLSLEKRVSIRDGLGNYAHDLKHLIGLVAGANAVLERKHGSALEETELEEMVELIVESAFKIDAQIDLLTTYLNHQIDIEDFVDE